jgi:shikimate kinase
VRTVVLLGLRGAGKSAVARELAARLGLEAVDLDPLVAARAGKSIAAIFAEHGESRFRDLEAEELRLALEKPGHRVLAPGGGIVLRPANRARLAASSALVVYLAAKPETLARRVEADPATARDRPALAPGGALAEAKALLAAREPLYRELSHATIETDSLKIAEVVARVLALL